MRHTPGPWTVGKSEYNFGCNEVGRADPNRRWPAHEINSSRWLATVANVVIDSTDDECHAETVANARLIAAAPDLLAACIEAESNCTSVIEAADLSDDARHPLYDLREVLRAAIKKAEGNDARN